MSINRERGGTANVRNFTIRDFYPLVTVRLTGQTEINVWGRGAVSHHEKRFDL
jgi:hypothetical protein